MNYAATSTHKRGITITVLPKSISHGLKLEVAHDTHWSCTNWKGKHSTFTHTFGFSDSLGLNGEDDELN